MFDIQIRYTTTGKTRGVFIVNPEMVRGCSGESLPEVLSKFVLEVAQLQQTIFNEEKIKMAELRNKDDK